MSPFLLTVIREYHPPGKSRWFPKPSFGQWIVVLYFPPRPGGGTLQKNLHRYLDQTSVKGILKGFCWWSYGLLFKTRAPKKYLFKTKIAKIETKKTYPLWGRAYLHCPFKEGNLTPSPLETEARNKDFCYSHLSRKLRN